MNVVWLATAERDLDALTDYIAVDNPQAALRIFNTIRHSVERLAVHPHLGRAGRVERTRELVIPNLPYIVAYTITAQEVRILAVLHTARKWPESFPRE
jgi:addiction module RelE/StbE family toxin